MSTPDQPQPDRQPPAASSTPSPPAAGETRHPTDSVPMATGSFANLPIRFGRDKVEKLPGKGAMGAVYLARDTQLQRLVALKIPKLSGKGSEKLLKRLKTEAMAAAQDVIAALSAIGLAVASSVLGSTAPSSGYYSLGHSEIPASEL